VIKRLAAAFHPAWQRIAKESRKPGNQEGRQEMRLEYEGPTGKIIGAAVDVHKNLGPGFIESVYENALCVELRSRAVSFHRQLAVPVLYRSVEVGQHRLDLFVDGKLIR
jgi:hypothetical protein